MKNELRQDPFTKKWAIIARGRSKRPKDISKPGTPPSFPLGFVCPMCPGQEHQSKEIFRIGKGQPGKSGWDVR